MIINIEEIKKLIRDSGIPTTQLEKGTGVNRVTISNLRSGRSDWSKVWLSTLEKFQEFINENEGEIKMMSKKQLELNELKDLNGYAKQGVFVDLPEGIVDMLDEWAKEEGMTTAEFVDNYVDDLNDTVELHIDGSIAIKGEGLIVLDDSNLDGIYQVDWLGENSNFKEYFEDAAEAKELSEKIDELYFN